MKDHLKDYLEKIEQNLEKIYNVLGGKEKNEHLYRKYRKRIRWL